MCDDEIKHYRKSKLKSIMHVDLKYSILIVYMPSK